MKLRNKKTGEIATLTLSTNGEDLIIMGNDMYAHITKLSELKDYEDYEEPKGIQCIYYVNHFDKAKIDGVIVGFGNKEEAKKALEKLKAYKRLKDKGFRFDGWGCENQKLYAKIQFNKKAWATETESDLDLLFGGEE